MTVTLPNLNPKAHSESILRTLEERVLEPREERRLGRELARVRTRLESGDYQRCSFVGNTFNIPERAEDFLTELEFYSSLGRKWQRLIEAVGVKPFSRVLDLCPGMAPKVELGLYYSGFAGTVVACDSEEEQLRRLRTFIGLFDVSFTVDYRAADIFSLQGESFDAILGNHIFDDLLLERAAGRLNVPMSLMYESEELLKQLCSDALSKGDDETNEVAAQIVDLAARLLHSGGVLVLTHYPSYIERVMGLSGFGQMVEGLLRAVRERGLSHSLLPRSVGQSREGGPVFAAEHVVVLCKQ